MLMLYGADFPTFLHDFQPAQPLLYWPDPAALKQALRESCGGADALPITPDVFAQLTEPQRLTFAYALRLVWSHW